MTGVSSALADADPFYILILLFFPVCPSLSFSRIAGLMIVSSRVGDSTFVGSWSCIPVVSFRSFWFF